MPGGGGGLDLNDFNFQDSDNVLAGFDFDSFLQVNDDNDLSGFDTNFNFDNGGMEMGTTD